jgi:hypothetical protein
LFTIALEGYLESATTLQALFPLIGNKITGHIIKKCTDSLQPLYAIKTTYIMTNREIPTRPSSYVSGITNSLEQFINEVGSFLLPTNKSEWVLQILTAVTEK